MTQTVAELGAVDHDLVRMEATRHSILLFEVLVFTGSHASDDCPQYALCSEMVAF